MVSCVKLAKLLPEALSRTKIKLSLNNRSSQIHVADAQVTQWEDENRQHTLEDVVIAVRKHQVCTVARDGCRDNVR